jgi:hypothetical protein
VPLAFDDSGFPRVEVTWVGVPTDAEADTFFQKMDGWFARGQPFSLLIDARHAAVLSADQRHRLLAHMKKTAAQAEALLVHAFVFEGALVRAFYFGITWAIPMSFPSKAFAHPDAAREWLAARLKAHKR